MTEDIIWCSKKALNNLCVHLKALNSGGLLHLGSPFWACTISCVNKHNMNKHNMISVLHYSNHCDVAISRMANRQKKKTNPSLQTEHHCMTAHKILTDITESWQESTNKSLEYFWSVFNNNNNNYITIIFSSSSNKQESKTFL